MDAQNQTVSEPAMQAVESEIKKCNHVPIIVTLAILTVCGFAFGGYELCENIRNKDQASCFEIDNSNENKDDTSKDESKNNVVIAGSASFAVPNPPSENGTNDGTVKFEYGIYKDILFTYSIYHYLHYYGHVVSNVVSNNIDVKTGEKLSNNEVLERVDTTVEKVYRKILENMVNTVSTESFLLNTQGIVGEDSISVDDFKDNIDEYIDELKNDQGLFYVFLKDSKITVSYEQNKVLEKLGMSTHMGSGLVFGYVEVEL